jgi:hypothetical protein
MFNLVDGLSSDAASSPPGMASLPVMTSNADTLQQFRPRPCPRSLTLYWSFRGISTLSIFRFCHIFSVQTSTIIVAFSNLLFPKRIIGNCVPKSNLSQICDPSNQLCGHMIEATAKANHTYHDIFLRGKNDGINDLSTLMIETCCSRKATRTQHHHHPVMYGH